LEAGLVLVTYIRNSGMESWRLLSRLISVWERALALAFAETESREHVSEIGINVALGRFAFGGLLGAIVDEGVGQKAWFASGF